MSKVQAAIENAKAAGLVEREAVTAQPPKSVTAPSPQAPSTRANVASITDGRESVYLAPESVEPVELGDRMERDGEDEKIERLARSIEANGQEVPGIVTREKDGTYKLHAGRRRQAALMLLNAELAAGADPYLFWCVVDTTGQDMYRKSLAENVQREEYTAIEKAHIAERVIRSKFKPEEKGRKGGLAQTQIEYAAAYLGVKEKTVRDWVRLLKAPGEVQQDVHNGKMTVDAALALMGEVAEPKREEVLAKAKEKAKAQAETVKTGRTESANASRATAKEKAGVKAAPAKEAKVGAAHVRAAARETAGAVEKPRGLTRGEILDWVGSQDCPANGYEDGAVNVFARYFCEVYAKGEGTERTLQAKFDAMVEKADRGTKPSADKVVATAVKVDTKKVPAKPPAKPPVKATAKPPVKKTAAPPAKAKK